VVVVGGATDPAGDRLRPTPLGRFLENHEDLFEIRLVVVGAEERRTPVVHRVDEQVVEHDPSVAPDDPAVVDDPRIAFADPAVPLGSGGRRAAGDAASDEQRRVETGIDEPGEQADAGQAPGRAEVRSICPTVPPRQREPIHRVVNEPEIQLLAGPGTRLGQPVEVQLAGLRHEPCRRSRPDREEGARLHVGVGGHREEQLAVREPDDRLVRAQQIDVAGHAPSISGCSGPVASSRTDRWPR